MILRFEQKQGRDYTYGTCAILLTHQKDSGEVSAHPSCIDLRKVEVTAHGTFSFRWRDEIDTDLLSYFYLVVHGIGVGAQQWLDTALPAKTLRMCIHASQIAS